MTYYYTINIDWDGDGTADTDNEAQYCIDLDIERGFNELYNTGSEGLLEYFAPVDPGRCTLVFDNTSKRFSAWNTTGALYGNIFPGKKINVYVNNTNASSDDTQIFTGIIKDIREDRRNRLVTVDCSDPVDFLQSVNVFSKLRLAAVPDPASDFPSWIGSTDIGVTTKNSITNVLTWANYPWTTTPVFNPVLDIFGLMPASTDATIDHHYAAGETAFLNLYELSKATYCNFFVQADGAVHFGSLYGVGTTDVSSDVVPTDYSVDVFLKDMDISQPWENIITRINSKEYVKSWSSDGFVNLYSYLAAVGNESKISVPAESSDTFVLDYSFPNADASFAVISTPTQNVRVYASTVVVPTSDYDWTLRNCGILAKLELKNYTTDTIMINSLTIQGQQYLTPSKFRQKPITTSFAYSNKIFVYDALLANITPNVNGFNWMFGQMGYDKFSKTLTVHIETQAAQFAREINDLVTFSITDPDLQPYVSNAAESEYGNRFRIMKINHKWQNENGQSVLTTWKCRHVLMRYTPDT